MNCLNDLRDFAWRLTQSLPACLGLLATPPAMAQLQGDHPPFTYYEIGIPVYPQNFAIAQDNRSFVYVGNTNGVVIYDGEQWQLAELPNKLHVRSLKADGNRVYVGGYDQFGYIEMDDRGLSRFHDLTHLFKDRLGEKSFADIWDVLVTPRGIFFRALRHLFFYDPGSGNTGFWEHEGRFGAITWYRDAPLLQFRGQGFKQLRDGEWRLISGAGSLTSQIHTVLPLSDGGLLGIGADTQWMEINEHGVSVHSMPPGFPPADTVVSGIASPDGTLIMGTRDGFVHFYDPGQNTHRSVKVEQGFLPEVALGRDGVVLTVGDSGFYAIPWPSEWTQLDASNGLTGSFERVRKLGDNWYVLGSGGIFLASPGGAFVPLDWTPHEAWDLLQLDEGTALFAESYRLLRVGRNGGPQPLSDDTLYPRLLRRSRFQRDIIYVGTENGVAIYQQRADEWRLVHPPDLRGVRVSSLVEISADEIWVGSEGAGLYRLTFSRSKHADEPWQQASTEIGRAEGIAYGDVREAFVAESPAGEVLVSTRRGLYLWESGRFTETRLGGLMALRGPDELLTLDWSPDGVAWAYSDNRVFVASGNGWVEKDASRILHGAFQSLYFDGHRAIFGGNASVMILDARVNPGAVPAPTLSLTRVELERQNGARERLALASQPELARHEGWLHIQFSLPDLNRPQAVRYQTRLLPVESGFSDWSESNRLSYLDLAPGQYRLLMRARDSHGNVIERPPFNFSVVPPWHATTPARLTLAILALLLFAVAAQALARRRSRALAAENLRLEGMVTVRTRELESANRQLESLAHLDSLTEIPNRRRLETYLKEVWQLSVERGRELAIAIVDVDHFKNYNDTHGHLQGDRLLKEVAGVLSHSLRRGEDLVARYGGEEFLLVFPGADRVIAMQVAETVRERIADSDFGITVSIGVAVSSPEQGGDVQALLAAADTALYAAKNAGRNRVKMAP